MEMERKDGFRNDLGGTGLSTYIRDGRYKMGKSR